MSDKGAMIEALSDYGRRSVRNLNNGVRDVREYMAEANESIPEDKRKYIEMVYSLMPGVDAVDSIRSGDRAFRAFDKGDYGQGLIDLGQSVRHGANNLLWFVPGMGIVKGFK